MYNTPFHTKDLKDLTFLVTGGSGFIGSNIVEYLLKYNAGRVIVLDNLSTGFEENIRSFMSLPNFRFIKGDICKLEDCHEACKNADYVLHHAALGSVPRSIKNPIDTHEANTTGFINMLIAARDAKVKRFVYASSSSVYGDSKALPKVDELYGEIFSKTYNMEILGLRYFNIFGPRQNPKGEYAAAIPLFINAILQNISPVVNGDGEQTRDFTFVENAVQANIKAAFADQVNVKGDVFNIAVGERVSLNELIGILKELARSNVNCLYREERAGDVRDSLADISKAKSNFGYEPHVKIREGLQHTFEWFRHKNF
jgi:UDP-N-acetylglucosamine 4-epimerase